MTIQRTAADRERRNQYEYARDHGLSQPDEEWFHGNAYLWARQQFQALYLCIGSYPETLELQPDLAPYPRNPDGTWKTLADYITWQWCRSVDLGDDEIPEKVVRAMEKKIEMHFRTMARKTITESGRAVRELAQLARKGELATDKQVQLLYAANAHNYGLGNYGQFIKNTAPQQPQELRIGRLNLIAGTKPPSRRKLKEPKQLAIEGEFRELDGHPD